MANTVVKKKTVAKKQCTFFFTREKTAAMEPSLIIEGYNEINLAICY